MSSSLTNTNRRHLGNESTAAVPAICVVDPQAADYQAWRELAERNEIQLCIFTSAGAALRHAQGRRVDLWVVNTELPGISGCELCGMLKAQGGRASVYLVTDRYSPAVEQSAWAARATMFDPKPLHIDRLAAWLAHWRDKRTHERQSISGRPIAFNAAHPRGPITAAVTP